MADFLDRVLQQLAQQLPELTPERRLQAELHIRQVEGGIDAGYIAKRPTLQRISRMGHALQHGAALGEAIQAAGVKRRQGYNILRRPLVKPGR
jgi:hypothetical protein